MDTNARRIVLPLIGLFALLVVSANSQAAITTGSLFEEMVDMAGLARFPEPAYRTVQFSSTDRRSNLPGGPDWFANSDGFGGEPIPNFEKVLREPDADGIGEYLIADVAGPGAVVRLWTAAIEGQVRVVLDDAETPIYEGGADAFFRRPYESFEPFKGIDAETFGRTVYQRDASYAPIPFAKRLRVVWTGNVKRIHFYELQVRLYDKDASVVSFRPEDIRTYRETIEHVIRTLADPDKQMKPDSGAKSFEVGLSASETVTVAEFEGSHAVEQLTIRLTASDMDKALRQTVLQVTFDGYPWPQVQSPVGDFFGAAPGINPYQSLPFTVQPDGTMVCRFVMPFERSCKVELVNEGGQRVEATGAVAATPWTWDVRSMHFRARWRVDHDLIASNRDVQDLPFLLAQGKGVYVGTTAYLLNPNQVPTPYGNWWGEGDEKIFVDNEPMPSIFGTGSEDYFNYSWSSPDIFLYPYCGQPRNDGPGNRGFVTNYRWHILDPIPFHQNLRFYMELYSHERTPGVSYARIGYHYARPGLTDDHLAITPADLRAPELPVGWNPAARMGAANSVFHTSEDCLTDRQNTRLDDGALWAGGKLLVWTPRNAGERKSFKLTIDTDGRKQINVAFAMTPRSGKVAFYLDGEPLPLANRSEEVDLYRPYRTLLRRVALRPGELTAGEHTLTLEWTDTTGRVAEPEVGIDFFWVQRQ
ncbi:glycoside hydrolase family 172 protein [Anaerobaca lacustris]|uniref:DUF2961 domain-containing protein n=1 Tax=Anaerobaca lacustris TaxID=3044600 RepID=A0AAW6TZM5_9BACT|nr:DUF2961 domain-containing protein [Sedimentisphaerales bacterium M17dextr]